MSLRILFSTITLAGVILSGAACSFGDSGKSPAWIVSRYYAPGGFPGATSYMTPDFARTRPRGQSTVGATLSPSAAVESRAVTEGPTHAVYATSITEKGEETAWYTYLQRDKRGWRIEAVRSFALPDTLTPVVTSDSALKAYLVTHTPVLDSVARAFRRRAVLSTIDVDDSVSNPRDVAVKQLLTRAGADAAFRDSRFPYCVFVRLGGIERRQAGYMYAPEGCIIPPMTPDNVIYIERGAGSWYVYKAL